MYIFIFFSKTIENAIATLRSILISNGKKLLGAFLNLIINIIWVISTGLVVLNIKEDPFKVVVFALGSFLGSLIGSIMEEKIAIGSNLLFTIVDNKKIDLVRNILSKNNHKNFILKGDDNDIIITMVNRKNRNEVLNLIRNIDSKAIIISEMAKQLSFK